ncbi:MAG: mitochondrial carrier domain-containing protein [Monoraphidium minutum]|nr:MAG: mitochondrial carrier domain-containing protein [Monoraphidium minutum]
MHGGPRRRGTLSRVRPARTIQRTWAGETVYVIALIAYCQAPAGAEDLCGGMAPRAVGGMAGVVAGQPLDTLRIRLQQRGCKATSVLGVWRGMAGAEGARGLFRGLSYPLYTTALQNAVTFQSQRAGERALTAADAPRGLLTTCAAGMFAGAVQTLISSPVELLKIRQQLQRARPGAPGYVGPLGTLRNVVAQEGAAGLFRGFGVTLLRDIPSYGLYFVVYEVACGTLGALQRRLTGRGPAAAAAADAQAAATPCCADNGEGGGGGSTGGGGATSSSSSGGGGGGGGGGSGGSSADAGGAVQFLAGGLAGMLAWLSVYPLDVVKSRIQARPARASRYSGAWHCAVQSVREEGRGVFAKGLGATLSRAFVVNAAIFACFEAATAAMDDLGAPAPAAAAAAAPAAAAPAAG